MKHVSNVRRYDKNATCGASGFGHGTVSLFKGLRTYIGPQTALQLADQDPHAARVPI